MEINGEILKVFKDMKIYPADGICYLMSLYYGYTPTYVPEELKIKINATGIIAEKNRNLHWNIPLFKGQEVAFDWVKTEYIPLFEKANPSKGGKVRETTRRMKTLFAENPEIRKEDIIGATKLYINNTNPNFLRFPHFFIFKGKGVAKMQDILDWLDKYKSLKDAQVKRASHTNTLR